MGRLPNRMNRMKKMLTREPKFHPFVSCVETVKTDLRREKRKSTASCEKRMKRTRHPCLKDTSTIILWWCMLVKQCIFNVDNIE